MCVHTAERQEKIAELTETALTKPILTIRQMRSEAPEHMHEQHPRVELANVNVMSTASDKAAMLEPPFTRPKHRAPTPASCSTLLAWATLIGLLAAVVSLLAQINSTLLIPMRAVPAQSLQASPSQLSTAKVPIDPLKPFAGLGAALNPNASERFFTAYWNATTAKMHLHVPTTALGVDFVAGALVSRGDGTRYLLHQPLTNVDNTVYRFELAPSGVALDVTQPQLLLRLPPEGGTLTENIYERGAWGGWLRSLDATTIIRYEQRANSTNGTDLTNGHGSAGSCMPTGPPAVFAVAEEPPPPSPLRNASSSLPPCAYVMTATSFLVDVTPWLLSGVVLDGDPVLSKARLVGARAFASNLDATIQAYMVDEGDEESDPSPAAIQVSFAELPPLEPSFAMRASDDRLGYWVMHYTQLGGASASGPVRARELDAPIRVIQRWRLQKADPLCTARCQPMKPITYHVDPSVPPRWRPTVKRAIEVWNAAFEEAGFANAVVAVLPGEPAWPSDYSAGDLRYSSISWSVSTHSTYAVGPHTFDPRTGEILDADISKQSRAHRTSLPSARHLSVFTRPRQSVCSAQFPTNARVSSYVLALDLPQCLRRSGCSTGRRSSPRKVRAMRSRTAVVLREPPLAARAVAIEPRPAGTGKPGMRTRSRPARVADGRRSECSCVERSAKWPRSWATMTAQRKGARSSPQCVALVVVAHGCGIAPVHAGAGGTRTTVRRWTWLPLRIAAPPLSGAWCQTPSWRRL